MQKCLKNQRLDGWTLLYSQAVFTLRILLTFVNQMHYNNSLAGVNLRCLPDFTCLLAILYSSILAA